MKTRGQEAASEGDLPRGVVEVIRGLVEEGALAKAAKHLISRGVADSRDPAVASKLRDLHPDGPSVILGPGSPLTTSIHPQLDLELSEWTRLAVQAIASFPPALQGGQPGSDHAT